MQTRSAEGALAQALAHARGKRYKQAHKAYERAMSLDPMAHSPEVGFGPSKGDPEEYAGGQ